MPLTDFTPEEIAEMHSRGIDPSTAQLVQQPQQTTQPIGTLGTIGATAKAHAGSYVGGGGAAIGAGALLAPWLAGPEAGIPADILMLLGSAGAGAAGAYGGQKAQQALESPDTYDQQQLAAQQAAEQNPITAGVTDIAGGALASGGRPSFKGIKDLIGAVGGKGLTAEAKGALVQAALNPAINAGASLAQGEGLPSLGDSALQAAGGALFSKTWLPHGRPGIDEPKEEINNTATEAVESEPTITSDTPYTATDESGSYKIGNKYVKSQFIKRFSQDIPADADDITAATIKTLNDKLRSTPIDDMRNALHQVEVSKSNATEQGGEMGSGGINEWGEPNEEVSNSVKPSTTGQDVLGKSQELAPINPNEQPTSNNAKDFLNAKMEDLTSSGVGSEVSKPTVLPKVNPVVEDAKIAKAKQVNTEPQSNAEQLEEQFERTGNVNSPLSDYNRYQELTRQASEAAKFGQLPHPDVMKEIESIKNRYGGMQPPQFPENHVLTPVALQAHIIGGNATTGSVLHSLANTEGHPFQELAKHLFDISDAKSLAVKWSHNPNLDKPKGERSYYDPSNKDTVNIGTGSAGDSRVVMEEAIHSMTSKKLPLFTKSGAGHLEELSKYLKDGKNPHVKDLINSYLETAKALNVHDALFTDSKSTTHPDWMQVETRGAANEPDKSSKIPSMSGKGHTGYAMGNLHEFIAQAFKDPGFQRTLDGIKTTDGRTVWQKVVDSVRKLLGLSSKEGSMLDRVLRTSSELVKQTREEAVEGKQDGKISAPPKEESHTPEELKLPKDKYLGKFGATFRSVLDKVRDIGSPVAKRLADHMQMAVDREQELKGKWSNAVVQGGEPLSAFDKAKVSEVLNKEREIGTLLPQMLTNANQRSFYNLARTKLTESGQHRLSIGEPVLQAIQGKNGKVGYFPRNLKQISTYFPSISDSKISSIYRANSDHEAIAKLDKEFHDYNTKNLGMSEEDSKERIANYKTMMQGEARNSNISQQDYYNANRKSMGSPLPPSFREADPVKALKRYFDRSAKDSSHYEFLEKDHKIMSSLGQTKDAWGNKIPSSKEGSIANNQAIKAALSHWQGHNHSPGDVDEHSLSSLLSSAYIAGPALEVHKAVSNIVKSLSLSSNPIELTKAITSSLFNINKGYQHAVENGAVKLSANSALGMLNGTYSAAERMHSLASAIRKVSTLNDITTKVGGGLVQSINESIIPSKVLRANAGDVTSQQFLKRLDPTYTKGKQYSQQEIEQLASRSASYIHGTGDIRQLPAWMLNDSEFSGFFSLAHWSVAQTNNFMKEVYEPALRGDVKPLIVSALGSVAGGYIIKQLREDIQGKKNPIPSLQEIDSSEKGLEGNKGLVAYNIIAAMQYSGFGGLLSQIAKYPFDFAYKNNPQGATFPLDEVVSDTAKTFHQVGEAIANDPNVNWIDLAKAVAMHTLSTNIQLARIGLNQGIDHGLITGLPAEKKMLGDRLGQLRRFDMVSELPYNDIDEASNPYMNIEQKKFKTEQDLPTAAQELPDLVNNIFTTYGHNPEVLMNKLKALKQNQYSTFPSMENAPMSFFKYLSYLSKEEGPEKAQAEMMDYMKHRTTNEVKSSLVP